MFAIDTLMIYLLLENANEPSIKRHAAKSVPNL